MTARWPSAATASPKCATAASSRAPIHEPAALAALRLARSALRPAGLLDFPHLSGARHRGDRHVGSRSAPRSIAALVEQGQPLLGGDVEVALIHRQATPARTGLHRRARARQPGSPRCAPWRSPAKPTTLVEIKAVDELYPLYGTLDLAGGGDLPTALARQDGVYGADPDATARPARTSSAGDKIKIGDSEFDAARHRSPVSPTASPTASSSGRAS